MAATTSGRSLPMLVCFGRNPSATSPLKETWHSGRFRISSITLIGRVTKGESKGMTKGVSGYCIQYLSQNGGKEGR